MHYYQHHIGDFRAGCFNMTRIERALYREMLDIYYDTESPLPDSIEAVCKLLGLREDGEKSMVSEILLLKFQQVEGRGWVHERCEKEIADYRAFLEKSSRAGKASAAARANKKTTLVQPEANQPSTDVEPALNGGATNQQPLTTNHKPKEEQSAARGTRLPQDWRPSPEDQDYCKKQRPDLRLSEVAQNFYDYWIAQPGAKGRKADWSATWRGWVRKESLGSRPQMPVADVTAGWK